MKKNFPLQIEGKNPERTLEAVKHEIRKYFKRERNRALPKEVDFWDFDCKVGLTAESAEVVKVGAVVESLGTLAKEGAQSRMDARWYDEATAGIDQPKDLF
jgi:hypothetical protein